MYNTAVIMAGIFWGGLLTGLYPVPAAPADTVWQWTDTQGRAHFSDMPPADASLQGRQTLLEHQSHATAGGLRPGEREALRRMGRQRARQRELALAARRRNDHAVAAQRSACRATRDKLHSVRDREQRKHYSGYLRKNCW
jgi:hypothetical protein